MTNLTQTPISNINADVVIVGAGLVGLTAAIAMARQHKRVVIVDSRPPQHNVPDHGWDARIYALTENTMNWLKALGVWSYLDATRVNTIDAMELWEPQCNAPLTLRAEDAHLLHMGCILENSNLMRACLQTLADLQIEVVVANPTHLHQQAQSVSLSLEKLTLNHPQIVHAKLLIAADGINSWVRQQLQIGVAFKSFQQTAIVANFNVEHAHANIARQWFLPHETMAWLPLPQQAMSMVWAVPSARAATLLQMSADALTQEIAQFGHAPLGKLNLCGEVMSFDLHQQTAQTLVDTRVVLMGDAAHQVHPMAGQGVNLGFRDVMQFANMTAGLKPMHDMGDNHFLRQYARARQLDIVRMNTLTSGLDALFSAPAPWLQTLTKQGMQAINRLDWLKKYLVQTATL